MAGLGDLLQRISRSLEEASAQRPGDDLRARLGYGTGDEDDDDDPSEGSIWEPEAEPRPESARAQDTARATGTTRTPEPRWAPAAETLRSSAGGYRAPPHEAVVGVGRPLPAAPPRPHASPESRLSERVRTRLRTPDALREAFVVKELLDRPLARRRRR